MDYNNSYTVLRKYTEKVGSVSDITFKAGSKSFCTPGDINDILTITNFIKVTADKKNQRKAVRKDFYNLREVSKITGITELGLKGRIKRGTLIAYKDSNKWLVSADELEASINRIKHQQKIVIKKQ